MALFDKFLKKKEPPKEDECVLIYLDAANLSDEIYAEFDLSTLEDQLIDVIQKNGVGEFDGNEAGEGVTTLYTYGPDADALYRAMEPVLIAYPLCRNARIVIRKGGPGSPQSEVHL